MWLSESIPILIVSLNIRGDFGFFNVPHNVLTMKIIKWGMLLKYYAILT